MYNLNRLYQSNIFNLPKQHIHTAYQSDPLKPKRCRIHHPPGVHRSIATLRPFTFEFIPYTYIIVAWHISFIVYLLCFFLVLLSTLHLLAVANRVIKSKFCKWLVTWSIILIRLPKFSNLLKTVLPVLPIFSLRHSQVVKAVRCLWCRRKKKYNRRLFWRLEHLVWYWHWLI